MSPGTTSFESTIFPDYIDEHDLQDCSSPKGNSQLPLLRTPTGHENFDISRIRSMVCNRDKGIQFHWKIAFQSRTHLLGFNQRAANAEGGNKGYAECIVVVVVNRPQNDTGDLENVEWVKDLEGIGGRWKG